jgi:hypothetical protein
MRHALLGPLLILVVASRLVHAQPGDVSPSPEPAALPAQPEPIADPNKDPLPPDATPIPRPRVLYTPPPPERQIAPSPSFFDAGALDGFATRFWVSADYLLWWTKDARLPALVTTGSVHDAVPGALGQPGTQVLFGGDFNAPVRSGGRFRGGYWFTPDQTIGLDGTFFFLGEQASHFAAASNGLPILARPFVNAVTTHQDADLIAFPGAQSGLVVASLYNRFWGIDTNLRSMLFRGPSYQVSLLGGFRFLDLHESLRLLEDDHLLPHFGAAPTTWTTIMDRFGTSNQFYGGQIGTDVMWCRGRFFVDVLTKVALGASIQRAGITGWSAFSASNGASGAIGLGELALPSNLGRAWKDQFAVVPEVGVNLGYAVTRHLRLTVGYTFLYWSRVFRPGDQIDTVLNPTEFNAATGHGSLVGPARPTFTFKDGDFWAQGLNFGAEFRY